MHAAGLRALLCQAQPMHARVNLHCSKHTRGGLTLCCLDTRAASLLAVRICCCPVPRLFWKPCDARWPALLVRPADRCFASRDQEADRERVRTMARATRQQTHMCSHVLLCCVHPPVPATCQLALIAYHQHCATAAHAGKRKGGKRSRQQMLCNTVTAAETQRAGTHGLWALISWVS